MSESLFLMMAELRGLRWEGGLYIVFMIHNAGSGGDPPPIRHGDGTTFAFVDGHVEFWKWEDQRTIDFGLLMTAGSSPQPDNPDLYKSEVGVWGL